MNLPADEKVVIVFHSKEYFKENFYTDKRGVTWVSEYECDYGPQDVQWCWESDAGEDGTVYFKDYEMISSFCELKYPENYI